MEQLKSPKTDFPAHTARPPGPHMDNVNWKHERNWNMQLYCYSCRSFFGLPVDAHSRWIRHHTYHTRSVFAAVGLAMIWLVNAGFVQHMKTLIQMPAVIPWWLAKALNPIGPFTSLFVIAVLYQRDNAMTAPSVDDQLYLPYFFISALCIVFVFLMMFAPVTTDMRAFYPCGFAFGRTLMIGGFSTRTWCTGALCAILMFVRVYVETHAVVVAHRRGAPAAAAAAAGGEQVDAAAGGEPVVAAGYCVEYICFPLQILIWIN